MRIDVQGPDEVVSKYRSHYAFVEDSLDAHLVTVATCMYYLGVKEIDEESTIKQPMSEVLPEEEPCKFIYSIAKGILERYIKLCDVLGAVSQKTLELDMQSIHINGMFYEHQRRKSLYASLARRNIKLFRELRSIFRMNIYWPIWLSVNRMTQRWIMLQFIMHLL